MAMLVVFIVVKYVLADQWEIQEDYGGYDHGLGYINMHTQQQKQQQQKHQKATHSKKSVVTCIQVGMWWWAWLKECSPWKM